MAYPRMTIVPTIRVQETVVSYRAQRPSHLWHILALLPLLCVLLSTLSLSLALMPMPYYIFPYAFSGPKTQKRRRLVCVSPPPPLPSTALLRCPASCALGRGPVCEGVAAGWRASQTTRRTAFVPRACSPNWTRAPPCVYRRGLTQVCSVPPLRRLGAAVAPHLSSDTEAPLS
jgi:hypothetical protein